MEFSLQFGGDTVAVVDCCTYKQNHRFPMVVIARQSSDARNSLVKYRGKNSD